jgi:putative acetyltransferase
MIRDERPGDEEAVRRVHDAAFGRESESDIVGAMRGGSAVVLSLVAEEAGEVVGHVWFTRVSLGAGAVVGLGPIGVRPDRQGAGIGAALVRAGLDRLRADGHGAVVLLGSPVYYGRFGFRPASAFGVRWEHPAPEGAFQALELRPGALAGGGVARFAFP